MVFVLVMREIDEDDAVLVRPCISGENEVAWDVSWYEFRVRK